MILLRKLWKGETVVNETYKILNSIGSVQLKRAELAISDLIKHNIVDNKTSIENLLELLKEFSREEISRYKDTKMEQEYFRKQIEMEWFYEIWFI